MALWGSVQSMKQSLENNRALLKSHKSLKKQLDEKYIKLNHNTKLEFKKVSEEELDIIKSKIRKDAKKARIKSAVLSILALVIVVLIIIIGLTIKT